MKGLARIAAAAAAAITMVVGAVPAAASSPHTSSWHTKDSCTWGGFHNHTFVTAATGQAWTYNQWQFGSFYDPECTQAVQVKIYTNGSVYSLSDTDGHVVRNYTNTNFQKTDHNAQADSGTWWGFGMT